MERENIIHIDMDAFFASVEELDNPDLKGKPVAVCGKISERGVISTANYVARKYGVKSAMPVKQALNLCPQLILLEARFSRYREISDKIYEVALSFTPRVERASIDEFYLDVSGSHLLFGPTIEIAKKLKRKIKQKVKLSCSIGIAPNKLLAKIASDFNKPDGFTVIKAEEIDKFLDPLPVEKIPGIGPKTKEVLSAHGVYYVKDLKNFSLSFLKSLFGEHGRYIYLAVRGIDDSKVITEEEYEEKSVSSEVTLEFDTTDMEILKKVLLRLCDEVSYRLKEKKLKGKTLKIKVKYFDFKIHTKQITLSRAIDDANLMFKYLYPFLENLATRPVRLIGAGVSGLTSEEVEQLKLFHLKKKDLIDVIREVEDKTGIKLDRAIYIKGD